MQVTIPEKVNIEFERYVESNYKTSLIHIDEISNLDFDFLSGVYRSFLRSVGVVIEVRMYPYYHEVDKYQPIIIQKHGLTTTLGYAINHNEAEIAAINAGFELRAQQLENTDK